MLLMCLPVLAADSASLTVTANSCTVGEKVNVSINLSEYSLATGGSFEVKYDNTMLSLSSAEKGTAFSNINASINKAYTDTTAKVVWFGTTAPAGGEIITMVFDTLLPGDTAIELINVKLSTTGASSIPYTVTNADVHIASTICESIEIAGPDAINAATQYTAVCSPATVGKDVIKWTTDNAEIAVISNDGILYPVSDGTVTITASTTDGSDLSVSKTVVVDKVYCEKYMIDGISAPSVAVIWCPDESMDVDVAFASYKEGKLVCVDMVSETLKEGSNVIHASVDYGYENCDTAKIFLWEISENIKPVCDSLSIDLIVDTDGDGLSDANEAELGTNPQKVDTDADGLTDYQETVLGTNPLKLDTDNDSVSDYNEDCDEDGIKNGAEYEGGTNPVLYDTDADGLSDHEEINTYSTNPTVTDTDDDGATDGWEIQNGTNPLEANESFDVTATSGEDDSAVALTVSTTLSGEQANSLRIDSTNTLDYPLLTPDIPGYLDTAYDISVDGEIDSATLSFEYDTSLGTIGEDFDPRVYYFNEEDGTLTELPNQTVTDGVVSVDVSHFSCYILLNKIEFDKVWETDIKTPSDNQDKIESLDIAFVLDSSGSMSSSDGNGLRKTLTKEFIAKLGEKDRAAIIDFDSYARVYAEFTSDQSALNSAVDRIDASGGTDIYEGIKLALNQFDLIATEDDSDKLKVMFVLTDGQDGSSYSSYTSLIEKANNNNIQIYTVGLGSGVDSNLLTQIAESANGKYYFASASTDLTEGFGTLIEETIDFVGDLNKDGIPDYYNELIKSGDLVLTNGSAKFMGFDFNYNAQGRLSADYDGDGIKNGDELIIKYNNEDGKVYMSMYSDPMLKNSDGDMMTDYEEKRAGTNPLKDSIESGVTTYFRDDAGWYREYIVELYDNDWMFRQEQKFFGWGLVGGFEDSATKWLIEYLYNYYDEEYIISMTNKYIQRTVHDTINETFSDINKHIKDVKKAFDKTDEFYAAISDAVKYKKEANALLSRINALTPSNDAYGTYTELINLLEGDYTKALENYANLDESLLGSVDVKLYGIHENYRDVLDSTIGDTKLTGNKAFSYGLKTVSTAISISETVALFSKINANTIAFEDNFDILCELRDNSKREEIRAAAQTVINAMGEGYKSYALELSDACAEIVAINFLEDLASKFFDKNPVIKGYEISMAALKMIDFDKTVRECYEILCVDETIKACDTLFHQSVERVPGKYYFDSVEDTGDMMRYATHAAQLCYIGEKTYLSYLEGIWNGTKDSNYKYAKEGLDYFPGGLEMYGINIDYELK